jgi:lipopolysaccharide/colanic/teichoic acid biosynthesis glycosyltransferase
VESHLGKCLKLRIDPGGGEKNLRHKRKNMYFRIKRWLDVIVSLIGGVALSPLLLVLAAAVKLDSRGPVLFRQKRVGKDKSRAAGRGRLPGP